MTLVVSIKVNDGIVLAADSASTVIQTDANGAQDVRTVYNNADKMFNLVRRGSVYCPIGAVTFGAGHIGPASISTIVKKFRKKIAIESDPLYVDPENYSVSGVATLFRQFIFEDKYNAVFSSVTGKPDLGFVIAGYSSNADIAEEYALVALNGEFSGPELLPSLPGIDIHYFGQPEAFDRLLSHVETGIPGVLVNDLAISPADTIQVHRTFRQRLEVRLDNAAMPIQDAIDLAEFLVTLTTKFMRSQEDAQIVRGPIEIAAITKHHYYKV